MLLVEDDPVSRNLLDHLLKDWGYSTILAADGGEAWEILAGDRSPEIVITDWMMPGMDGIELCRRLRESSRYCYHYLLIISSRGEREDIAQALASGADGYLTKPVDPGELEARLTAASRMLRFQNELIHAREQLRVQATRDALTGLWNRTAFLDLLEVELERAERSQLETGLLLVDVDHFKSINDTLGHPAGDVVLQETSRRLRHAVRSCDFAGRFGGDEFCIALPQFHSRQLRRRVEAIRLAVTREPMRVGNTSISVTLSIGAIVAEGHRRSTSQLIAAADVALYSAKNAGRDRSVCCIPPHIEGTQPGTVPRQCAERCNPGPTTLCILPDQKT